MSHSTRVAHYQPYLMPLGIYAEVDGAAHDLARKGLTGAAGDELPRNMTVEAVAWINANQEEFRCMVAWWRGYQG